jgi:hypothetical protein
VSKTLLRAIVLLLISTFGFTQTVSAKSNVPVINNVCINRTTGILRSLRTTPVKACGINEVKVRANKVCVNKSSGKLRHLATNVRQVCRGGEIKLVWNQSIAAFVRTSAPASPISSPTQSTTSAGLPTPKNVATTIAARTFPYKVGDVGPGGGLVFFVDTLSQFDGFTYLEAAPVDLPSAPWASNSVSCFDISNAAVSCLETSIYETSQADSSRITAAKIGQGSINTTLIKTRMSSGGPVDYTKFAAGLADAYVYGTATDWYLPSINELGLMHTNLKVRGLGNFQDTYYWSSTEFGPGNGWLVLFGDGYFSNAFKLHAFAVRPVRSFG